MENNGLTGLVLCGGKSTRMVWDKGLMLRNGKYWCELAAEKLQPYCREAYFSIGPGQENDYRHITEPCRMITDDDAIGRHYSGRWRPRFRRGDGSVD